MVRRAVVVAVAGDVIAQWPGMKPMQLPQLSTSANVHYDPTSHQLLLCGTYRWNGKEFEAAFWRCNARWRWHRGVYAGKHDVVKCLFRFAPNPHEDVVTLMEGIVELLGTIFDSYTDAVHDRIKARDAARAARINQSMLPSDPPEHQISNSIRVCVVDYGRTNLMMRYRCPVTGKQVARSTGTACRKQADKVAAKWEYELQQGRSAEVDARFQDASLVRRIVQSMPPSDKRDRQTYVYLMRHANGLHKIGRSLNPTAREKTLQAEDPRLELVCAGRADRELERRLHARFAKCRRRGEWFELTARQVAYVKRVLGGCK